MNKSRAKAMENQSGRRSSRRIKEREAKELRRLLQATQSEPHPGDASEYPPELSSEEEKQPSPPLQLAPHPGFFSRDHTSPKHEDYDKDYLRYLEENPEEEEEESSQLSSINENEPVHKSEGPGYSPRAPTYDSDTGEWYRFHREHSISAREVSCPSTLESSLGPSMQSTAKVTRKGKGKAKK